MMNKRMKDTLDKRLLGVTATPRLHRAILAQTIYKEDVIPMKQKHRIPVALAAALIAFALITGVAFATGLAQSIFAQLKDLSRRDAEKFEAMDERSAKDTVRVPLTKISGSVFLLNQSYYDGEQLMLAYSMDISAVSADLSFGPSHEKHASALTSPWDAESFGRGIDWESYLTPEQYADFQAAFAQTGEAGAICEKIYVGDGLELTDGTYIDPDWGYSQDGWDFIEYATPLPDAARGKDALDLVFTVYRDVYYLYKTANAEYLYRERTDTEKVAVTIARNPSNADGFTAEYATDRYKSSVHAVVTGVNVIAEVSIADAPVQWNILWDSLSDFADNGIDAIYQYYLVVNGQEYGGMTQSNVNNGVIKMEFDYSAAVGDAAEIRLRPVYSISGAVAAEDIVIKIK